MPVVLYCTLGGRERRIESLRQPGQCSNLGRPCLKTKNKKVLECSLMRRQGSIFSIEREKHTITKYPTLPQETPISSEFWRLEARDQVTSGLVSPEACLPGWQMPPLLCPLMVSLHAHVTGVPCVSKRPLQSGVSWHRTLWGLDELCKGPVSEATCWWPSSELS